jgi:hypothetical protein
MNGWRWATIAFSSIVFLGSMVFIATVPAGTKGEIRLCDKAVSALLSSPDPVELRRASIIVRHLRCGIGFRLDDAGEFKP